MCISINRFFSSNCGKELTAEVIRAVLSDTIESAKSFSLSIPIELFNFFTSSSDDLYSSNSSCIDSATVGNGEPLWVDQNLSLEFNSHGRLLALAPKLYILITLLTLLSINVPPVGDVSSIIILFNVKFNRS